MGKGLKDKLIRIILAITLLGVGFAAGQYYLNQIYQRQVEVSYRRALSEFATHLGELTSEVGRARLAVSVKQRNLISSNIRRLIYAAQSNIGELPLGEIQLERIANLLAQAYEQTYSYAQDDSSVTKFDRLHEQIAYVNHEVQHLLIRKESEFPWVSWHEYLTTTTTVTISSFLQTLALINDDLEEFKAPIRSGEIAGEVVTSEEALAIASDFSEKKDLSFQITNESKGSISSYTVEAKDEEQHLVIEVSQKGGVVLWMASTKEVLKSRLALEQMVQFGKVFLEERGFPSLHVTDAQLLRNRATLTFVPEREGVLRYAEPIKVQVSADDGTILGFWGTPFYMAQSRIQPAIENIQERTWTLQDKVRQDVEVLNQRIALISNEQQQEVLATRLGVQYQGDYYLIYLNADTGDEEQIVQVSSPQFF